MDGLTVARLVRVFNHILSNGGVVVIGVWYLVYMLYYFSGRSVGGPFTRRVVGGQVILSEVGGSRPVCFSAS